MSVAPRWKDFFPPKFPAYSNILNGFLFSAGVFSVLTKIREKLVEKVAVPLVAERLSTAYNAMSRRQTACLTTTVSELLVYDPSEAALKKLLGSALEALKVGLSLPPPTSNSL